MSVLTRLLSLGAMQRWANVAKRMECVQLAGAAGPRVGSKAGASSTHSIRFARLAAPELRKCAGAADPRVGSKAGASSTHSIRFARSEAPELRKPVLIEGRAPHLVLFARSI